MKIGEILIHQNFITQEELELALWIQKYWGGLLGRILVSRGFLPEADLVGALSTQLSMPSVTLGDRCTPTGLCGLLPLEACISNLFFAFGQDPDSGTYLIAMADPRDAVALAALRSCLKRPFRVHLCGHLDLTEALYRLYWRLMDPASSRHLTGPMKRRAPREIIEVDSLVEEVAVPEEARAVYSAPLEAADDLEVLEESEMLAAMAARSTGRRTSGEVAVIVESGDFEVVSSDELPLEKPAAAPQTLKTPPSDQATTTGEGSPEEPKAAPETHERGESEDHDKATSTPQGQSATTDGPARKAQSGGGRRGLLAALADGPREPEKKSSEKKPPPSPFSHRDKK